MAAGLPPWVEQLYAAYRGDVYRLAYMMTGDRSVSGDVTQDVFLSALPKERAVMKNPRVWLFTAARGQTADLYKLEGRDVPLYGKLPYRDAADLYFLDALRPLAPLRRELIVCRFLFSLPHSETAKILRLSHKHVRKEYDSAVAVLQIVARRKEEFPYGFMGRPPETGL